MRAKRRIFAGSVCEQEVYTLPDRTKDVKKAEPRPRFSSAEEYEDFKQRLARRNHARMFNATFSPASLYTTITLDNEHEVHTFAEADKGRKEGRAAPTVQQRSEEHTSELQSR